MAEPKGRDVIEYITAAEFARWRTDFVAFRAELNAQLRDGFTGTHDRLDEINGRTRKNSEGIVELTTRLDRIDEDDGAIRQTVTAIQSQGCAQLKHHGAMIQTLQNGGEDVPTAWPRRKQVIVGGGLVAGGAALWPVLTQILNGIHTLLDHFAGR